jgi:tetratricopeptide (TPR) repeat protein
LANQSPKAERILARSLQVRPKDTDALILSAVILLNSGKFKDAEQKLLQALTFKPDSDVVHSRLSRVHRACGRILPQRQELTEALRINPNLLQARLELAENLMLGSATKSALGVLDAAPDQQKDTLTWIIHRNWALLDLGDQAALRKGIEAGLARGRSPDLLLQSGLLKMRAKDYPGAHAALEEGLQRSPEDPRLLWAIAQTHVLEGRATLASKRLQDHGNKWPHSPRVQLLVGEWLSRTGDLAGARRAFLAAKGADPHSVEADFQLARLDANEGKMDEARRRFVALAEQPGYQLSAQVWLASIADRAQNHAEAAEGYRRVLAMNPQNLIALNNLAYLLATHTDQLDEALQNAQRARELAPANADVEGTLGWVLYRKGMYDSALRYLKEASRNDGVTTSESAAIRKYHLGMAYLKTGDRELGLRTLASALQINSKLPEAETARLLLRTGEVH